MELTLGISCNQTFYGFKSKDKEEILRFLMEYDHEGSSIWLDIEYKGATKIIIRKDTKYGEDVYKFLAEEYQGPPA